MDWGREAKFQSEAVQAVASVCTASAALRGGCLLVEDVVWGELLTALEGTRGRGEFRKEAEDAVLGAEAESGAGHGVTAMDVDDGGLVDDSSGAAFGGLLQERAQVIYSSSDVHNISALSAAHCFCVDQRRKICVYENFRSWPSLRTSAATAPQLLAG